MYPFRNKDSFQVEDLLARLPTPKLEDHSMSAVCDCLFNILQISIMEAILHPQPEDAPCCGDRDALTMEVPSTYRFYFQLLYKAIFMLLHVSGTNCGYHQEATKSQYTAYIFVILWLPDDGYSR